MQGSVSERAILVTGATGGIGSATARWLAADGARLVLSGRRAPALAALTDELRERGTRVFSFAGDLSERKIVERLFAAARDNFGGLDAVVHCAGEGLMGPTVEASEEALDQLYQSNVRATFLVLQYALRAMSGQRRGQIVVPVGIAGRTSLSNGALYCATKHAVVGMLKAAAPEARRAGIAMTLIFNGATQTPLLDTLGVKPAKDKVLQACDVAGAIVQSLSLLAPAVMSEVVLQPEGSLVM